jgi:hypothetical protein
MELINLSAEPLGKLHSWIPHDLEAEQVVFSPRLRATGSHLCRRGQPFWTHQSDWRRFAVSDCGCGMRLARSTLQAENLDLARWNKVADFLRANKGGLGDLGGGNHLLDAIVP